MNDFIPALFQKWKAVQVSHSVTIVMTSRTYYDAKNDDLARILVAGTLSLPLSSFLRYVFDIICIFLRFINGVGLCESLRRARSDPAR